MWICVGVEPSHDGPVAMLQQIVSGGSLEGPANAARVEDALTSDSGSRRWVTGTVRYAEI